MNHTISAKKTALTATIRTMRRYIFVDSAQNFVWQSRQRYGERKSGCSVSSDSREDRRTLRLLQFGHWRRMGSVVGSGRQPPRSSGYGGSRDYRANGVSEANRRNADASRRGAGPYQARNGAIGLPSREIPDCAL